MRKGLWSPDEDENLRNCIAHHRSGSWSDIARKAGLQRCGKSCRRRWMNHLRPDLKREKFTSEEMRLVARLHEAMGNKWSEIASHLVGRTDNDVKNLWNTQIKRHLRATQQIGEDQPVTTMNNNCGLSFPFYVESNFNYKTKLNSEKPNISIHSSYPTTTTTTATTTGGLDADSWATTTTTGGLDADSWVSSSSFNALVGFDTHIINAQGLTIDEHELTKGILDRFSPVHSPPCQEANYDVHFNNHPPSNDQEATMQQVVLMKESFGCLLDGSHPINSMDSLARPITTITLPSSSVNNMYYSHLPYDVSSHMKMMVENDVEKQQYNGNAISLKSTLEVVVSDESSTGSTVDDTCSVGNPTLLELHYPLGIDQNNDDNHHQDQEIDGDNLSRRKCWSSSTSCDQWWSFETLYGTNEEYYKPIW